MRKQLLVVASLVMLLMVTSDVFAQGANTSNAVSTDKVVVYQDIDPETGERAWVRTTQVELDAMGGIDKDEMERLSLKFPIEGSVVHKIKSTLLGASSEFNFTTEESYALLAKFVELDAFNGANVETANQLLSEMQSSVSMDDAALASARAAATSRVREVNNK